MLKGIRHYVTVTFNNGRGRKAYGRALESGNREAERDVSMCVYISACMCRWERESREKGFTGYSNITEKKIRNIYLCYQKRGLKYSY